MIRKRILGVLLKLAVCFPAVVSLRVFAAEPTGNDLWFKDVFPEKLTNASGWEIGAGSALRGKMVGVYFSASWCGPCRGFTPQLVKFYHETAKKDGLEIVFVSSDKTRDAMMQYMKDDAMPWLAVPFDAPAGKALKRKLRIGGIPTLVIYGRDGRLISKNARWDVVMRGKEAVQAWLSNDYKPLTYNDYQNSKTRNAERPGGEKTEKTKWLPGPTEQWHIRMDTALAAALKEHKKIFILTTGSDWCGWCKKLYREVLSSREFIGLAREKLVLVYLDYPHFKPMPEYQKLYNGALPGAMKFYRGAPAAFIYDEQGRQIGRIGGYQPREKYMKTLRGILAVPVKNRRSPLLPGWVKKSPAELEPMLERLLEKKKQAAARAAETAEKVKGQFSFEIVSWGLEKDKADRPFDPKQEIRVPVGTEVYFRVRYRMPKDLRATAFLRMPRVSVSGGGQRISGSGEFVSLLCCRRSSRQTRMHLSVRLLMEESRSFDVAELPCLVVWED